MSRTLAEDTQLRDRLARAQGQLQAVLRMIDEGKDCAAIATQLSAASAAVHSAATTALLNLAKTCHTQGSISEEELAKLARSLH